MLNFCDHAGYGTAYRVRFTTTKLSPLLAVVACAGFTVTAGVSYISDLCRIPPWLWKLRTTCGRALDDLCGHERGLAGGVCTAAAQCFRLGRHRVASEFRWGHDLSRIPRNSMADALDDRAGGLTKYPAHLGQIRCPD